MATDPTCFSVLQPEPDSLVIEVLSSDGQLRLPIEPEDAESLGRQLLLLSASVLEARKSSHLHACLLEHMVEVPEGTYWMGALPEGHIPEEEGPRHRVTIPRPYFIGKTPVTQELYEKVTGTNPSQFACLQNPVEMVSWVDAIQFCNQLSAIESLRPAYTINDKGVEWDPRSNGYRLATEAEWEYAMLAGAPSSDDTGRSLKEKCWFEGNALEGPQPVGQLKPNEWGLFDMQGNVFEWVWDFWGSYDEETVVYPVGPKVGTDRVCRGGAWNRSSWFCRGTYRYADSPSSKYNNIGFRIARHLGPVRY